jgi:diguanylate cyclase (GGDEF)-like protein/PAS domain S-box-containing protein
MPSSPLPRTGGEMHLPVSRLDDLTVVHSPAAEPDLYRMAFHGAPLAMAIVDSAGRFFRVNEALCALVGCGAEDLLERPYECIGHPDDAPARDDVLLTGYGSDERRLRHRDGRTVWTRMSTRTVHDADGAELGTICVWEDVDERRRAHDRLAQLALLDPLTGVANRALLDDRLTEALRTRDREGGVVAVLFCDVDAFKAVNDSYGHGFGDTLLEIVAARLSSAVRGGDTVARVGGDEFVVVSLLHDAADADALLMRVGEALGDAILGPGGRGLALSVSVGMALSDGPGMCAADLLDRADRQMYAVKRRRVVGPSG